LLKKCEQYGADKFYGWNYGNIGMVYEGAIDQGSQRLFTWSNPTNGHKWLATRKSKFFCSPHSHIKQQSSLIFGNINTTKFPDDIFVAPKYCFGRSVQPRGCSPIKTLILFN